MNRIPVTVIIPVKNEEENLPLCLERLSDFDQVIVVDSSSTDSTPEVVRKFGYEYENFVWNGRFPKKRNWALQNLKIRNEWVLFLDADEYVPQSIKTEINDKIGDPRLNGYWILYSNHFMGKELRHGDEMKKLALLRKGKGEYEKIYEEHWSQLDMEVHEHPIVVGRTGTLTFKVTHNDFKGLEQYISRHNDYSSWEVKRYLNLRKKGYKDLSLRQKSKYMLLNAGLLPVVYFVGSYILKFGFLDGKRGYYFAKYKSNYFFQIQTKLVEFSSRQV